MMTPNPTSEPDDTAEPGDAITYLRDDDGHARFVQIDIERFGTERVERLVSALQTQRLRAECHALLDALDDDALPEVVTALYGVLRAENHRIVDRADDRATAEINAALRAFPLDRPKQP